jgi:hypothetical protein
MESHEGARSTEKPQPTVSKYALSQGVLKGRNVVDSYRNVADFIGYVLFAAWLFSCIGVATNLPRWLMDSAALTLCSYIIFAGLLGYGIHRGVSSFFFFLSTKSTRKILPGDPLIARVSSDLSVPEPEMMAAFENMLLSYNGRTEFLHGDDLITLKLKKKWDDVIGNDVKYLKVRREEVRTFASTLIAP